jgi:hypothetical protein
MLAAMIVAPAMKLTAVTAPALNAASASLRIGDIDAPPFFRNLSLETQAWTVSGCLSSIDLTGARMPVRVEAAGPAFLQEEVI